MAKEQIASAKEEIVPAGAISSFVTMFSNVVCYSRCKNKYLWSKGLKLMKRLHVIHWQTDPNKCFLTNQDFQKKIICTCVFLSQENGIVLF